MYRSTEPTHRNGEVNASINQPPLRHYWERGHQHLDAASIRAVFRMSVLAEHGRLVALDVDDVRGVGDGPHQTKHEDSEGAAIPDDPGPEAQPPWRAGNQSGDPPDRCANGGNRH